MTTSSQNGDQAGSAQRPESRVRPPEFVAMAPAELVRHRARLLDPATAVTGPAGARPQSTAYRADTLLLPRWQTLLPDLLERYNKALEPLGAELRPVEPATAAWARMTPHRDIHIPVLLLSRSDRLVDRAPDPWAALVALRRSFTADETGVIGLEHIVIASSIGIEGAPVHGGPVHGGPVHGGPVHGGAIALYTGSRNPVRVMLTSPPARRAPATLAGGRRPVVAVLDTGVGPHPWLPVRDLSAVTHPSLVDLPVSSDPVVEVSSDFQQLLADHEAAVAAATGATTTAPLDSPCEARDVVQPLLGLTDSHAGHGTFVAGVVHQTCPDARVLSLRVLHSDGIGAEGSCLLALDWLRARVESALSRGVADELVDVASLSLGFYPEDVDPAVANQIGTAITRLNDLGVIVVAAAGNDATTRPFLPAALGGNAAGTSGNPMLAAIGALNASGITTAAFSNHGEWVTRWAPGNALVSTVPVWQGAMAPGLVVPDGAGAGSRLRTTPDEDDLTTGFAVWAGTSFATPVVAGLLAGALAVDADHPMDPAGRRARAGRAVADADAQLSSRLWR
jgi:hypothetical protein